MDKSVNIIMMKIVKYYFKITFSVFLIIDASWASTQRREQNLRGREVT